MAHALPGLGEGRGTFHAPTFPTSLPHQLVHSLTRSHATIPLLQHTPITITVTVTFTHLCGQHKHLCIGKQDKHTNT